MKHTPSPWHIDQWRKITAQGETLSICGVSQPTGRVADDDIGYANAAFIVQACNSHDDLVAALEDLLGMLEFEKHAYRIEIESASNTLKRAKGK